MTTGNGKNFKTEYIRAILKRTNISFIYDKNDRNKSTSPVNGPGRDKPIKAVIKLRRPVSLDENFERVKSEKTVTFREPMTVSLSPTMAKKQNQPDPKSASSERAASETKHRAKSGSNPNEDSRSVQQRPRTYERAETGLPKFGTIRRSYEPDKRFRPLAVFKAFEREPGSDNSNAAEVDQVRANGISPGSDLDMDDRKPKQPDENFPISTFPYVGDDEMDKHKKLNAEAEKFGHSKSPGPYDSYLKRLKLERKALERNRPKEQPKLKRKPLLKRVQTKARWVRDIPEDPEPDQPVSPPPRTKEERASRILLDFKYSHAMEQLYKTQVRQSVNFSPMSDSFVNYSYNNETEIKNGCVVKTLGANVLNLRARTLPSCNPFELRMRRQLARERAMLNKKASVVSQSSVKSHLSQESLLKLRKASVCRKESVVSNAFVDENASISGGDFEHARLNAGRKSVDSQTGLPDIRIDRVENLVTRSLNSSPDGPEYLRKLSHPHTKTISLNLPTVVMEDV